MCGITGFWDVEGVSPETIYRMSEKIKHRGPDDYGCWIDEFNGVGLGHRRLSIIDLSQAGHQPMLSNCQRYVLVFNGEIYNHKSIRLELEREFGIAVSWKGQSDTETLLSAIEHWGLEPTLKEVNGMFALALWDVNQRRLFLARDRLGEKPLYYGNVGGSFVFASELKSLKECPAWSGDINKDALPLYLRYNYIPAPLSIYEGIFKLLPGTYVCIQNGGATVETPKCYWEVDQIAVNGKKYENAVSYNQIKKNLDDLLNKSVTMRMEADVPVGVFLSGGIDSTTVAAIMQKNSNLPIDSFSIGFAESSHNEAVFAKDVASYLGTKHTEFYIESTSALEVIESLPDIWDEPFADASQIPTFLLSQMAQNSVKVALTGDGADELFMGYSRHLKIDQYWNKIHSLPGPIRKLTGLIIQFGPLKLLNHLQSFNGGKVSFGNPRFVYKLSMLANVLVKLEKSSFCQTLVSHWHKPESGTNNIIERIPKIFNDELEAELCMSELSAYFDLVSYLPDDILTKVDRASMAVSLEARTPFLDHELVEFSFGIPSSLKIKDAEGKWLLKQVLNEYVPKKMVDRPKKGFSVPLADWLRGPLRDWAENLLDEYRLKQQGLFDATQVRLVWEQHKSGACDWHNRLWSILMFQVWYLNEISD